ncbi:unnamed protein product [Lactuca saligna]|uniref:Leucine-rich repeat-containing N-terminal plant-type domain-containing protein n=1 Tax=Lactuca saligna TaxID=75948 RepID=A0AA35YGY8_LACSI|nr:unnamed protein product [Lactuca saligna]
MHLFFSFFFFLIPVSSSSSFNDTHKCSPQQALDLLLFKQNLSPIKFSYDYTQCEYWLGSDYYPIMMNWNKNTDCCKWNGVTCNHFTGDVIGVDLSCGMLQGTIHPNSTLFRLPHLQTLNLAFNDLTDSQLPHDFSNSLTHLNAGQISREILVLPRLVSLDVSYNYRLQMQPYVLMSLLRNSTHLRELLIPGVQIRCVLPTYLNISSSLRSLHLSYTGLKGKLSNNIFNLRYLEELELSGNYLIGPLPKVNTSTNIPLKCLDLSFNNFSGETLDSIGHLTSLNYLDLSSCGLVGPLPKSLVNFRHLRTFDLSLNMFSGGLPSDFFGCRSLKILSHENNQSDGEINQGSTTTSCVQFINLTHLDLSWNNFTGVWDFDALLSNLPNLQSLDLSYSGLSVVSNNSFSYANPDFLILGLASCKLNMFPESLQVMKNLTFLDLSNNDIHGPIPDWAGEIGANRLYYLNLSHNSISGLPQFQWDVMEDLYLQSNQIQGAFPPSICNMRNLYDLDISNNSFSGVIPKCLGNINSSLEYLNVKSNQIEGSFPSSICNLRHLYFLDMSNNSFDGVIPQCLGNIIPSLSMVDIGNNHFHGSIPDVYKDCEQLEGLNFNGNQLKGKVPSSLSNCQSLIVLDLGNNRLNGKFPGWLGDLPKLQVLILKSNKLHGVIETFSTNRSVFLSMRVLDLSHNRFVGHLPRKYLQNFSAMKNVVKNSTKPKYLSAYAKYYSITTTVKGVEQEFPQILVDYIIIDISNNKFEGEIPDVIGSLSSLIVLDLSHNHLIGQIPSVLGNLSEIESLDRSWNQLTGEIPQSLADLTFLGYLNLSENHLKGRIPEGTQLSTFETSFGGNSELCGRPLPKKCGHPLETQLKVDEDIESGFTWRVVMMGYGCGTILGLVMGYVILSTGQPKWFNAIVDAAEHIIHTRKNTRRYVYIGK